MEEKTKPSKGGKVPSNLEDLDPQEQKRISKFYNDRLKVLKKARELSHGNEIQKAVEHYSKYLNALALWKGTTEEKLSPNHFDKQQDLGELLLISHVYWDMAKAYDRNTKLQAEMLRCLNQFCNFTIGFKYQYANAQVVKKFIKKPVIRNRRAFQTAHEKVRIRTKGCYISTYSFGLEHPVTCELRNFRDSFLIESRLGLAIAEYYDRSSPHIVDFLMAHRYIGVVLDILLIKPVIYIVFLISRLIVRS